MKENVAISVKDVGMRFNLNQEHVDNLKEYFIKILKRDLKYNEFWALKGINFEVKKGLECLDLMVQARVLFLKWYQVYLNRQKEKCRQGE